MDLPLNRKLKPATSLGFEIANNVRPSLSRKRAISTFESNGIDVKSNSFVSK